MLIPFIVVIPGIVAWVMYSEDLYGARSAFEIAGSTALNNDNAYPWLISTFIPVGVKGLSCSDRFFAGFYAEFNFHHFYDGYL